MFDDIQARAKLKDVLASKTSICIIKPYQCVGLMIVGLLLKWGPGWH